MMTADGIVTPDGADHRWHSLHVHRYVDQDAFLAQALAPAVGKLVASGMLARFFFLRYWQGGSHIRVRLYLPDDAAADAVEQLTADLLAYFAEHPGADGGRERERLAQAQPLLAGLEDERQLELRPADSVWPAEYAPETAKYGGREGVRIAEDCFHASSETALAALPALVAAPARRLGHAFACMVRSLHAVGMSPAEMAAFFAHYCMYWAPYVFDRFLDAWPDLLARQAAALRARAELLTSAEAGSEPFAAAVRRAWTTVHAHAERILPEVALAGPDAPDDRRARVVLTGYLHTHNNRLGLIPEQEAFLGFLGHHVLSPEPERPATEMQQAVRAQRERRTQAISRA